MKWFQQNPMFTVFIVLFSAFIFYSTRIYTIGTDKNPNSDQFRNGQLVWQKYNCQACHQLYGLGGHKGPDLTNIFSEPGKNRAYLNGIILSGGKEMPSFPVDSIEMNALLDFLQGVDKTGKSRIEREQVDRFGNYQID